MEQWYTLYTKSTRESQVLTAMQGHGVETFLPEVETKQDSKKRRMEPLFPCYLFIRANPRSVGLPQVQWTPGVRRIVSFAHQAVFVPEEVVNLIKHKLAEMELAGEHTAVATESGESPNKNRKKGRFSTC